MVTRPETRAQVKVKNFIIADSFSCQVEKGHVTDSISAPWMIKVKVEVEVKV